MTAKHIKFEGKITINENVSAKKLLELLKYLSEDKGFTVKKYESDEIKLTKKELIHGFEGSEGTAESDVEVDVEIEVSDNELEIEVESENMELVKELTSQIAARL